MKKGRAMKFKRKLIAVLLSATMILTFMPTMAFAEGEVTSEEPVTEEVQSEEVQEEAALEQAVPETEEAAEGESETTADEEEAAEQVAEEEPEVEVPKKAVEAQSETEEELTEEPTAEESIIDIYLDSELEFTATSEKSYQIYRFTPSEDGTYVFQSGGSVDTYASVGTADPSDDTWDISDDDSGDGNNFRIEFSGVAGTDYYLKARPLNDVSGDEEVTFSVSVTTASGSEDPEEPEADETWGAFTPVDSEITAGDVLSFTATSEDSVATYLFTPEESGYYIFYSTGGVDTYGRAVDGASYSEITDNDDGGEDNNFWLSLKAAAGVTYYLQARTYSVPSSNRTFEVHLDKVEAESVAYTPSIPFKVYEGSDSYTAYDDNDQEYTAYNLPYPQSGDVLTVDGTEYKYKNGGFYSEDDYISRSLVEFSSNQDQEHWTVGNTYNMTVSYAGVTCSVPVKVKEAVKAISFTPAKACVYVEGKDGYSDTDAAGTTYRRYSLPYFDDGDVLTVDGEAYTYDEDKEQFISESGDVIFDDDVDRSSDQYNNHWVVGDNNIYTVSYKDVTCEVTVTIQENPIKSLAFKGDVKKSVCEYTNGYWSESNSGEKYWRYDKPSFRNGDVLIVNGTTEYTYSNGYFRADGKENISFDDYTSDQSSYPWDVGAHEFSMYYYGVEVKYPVEITASPIESIEFEPVEAAELIQDVNGYTQYYDSYGEKYFYYYFPGYHAGDKLTVDGVVYTYKNGYFYAKGMEEIDTDDIAYDSDQEDEHWDLGDHSFRITYMGQFAEFPVKVVENPVKSIEYIPAAGFVLYANADGEISGWPSRNVGDKLIINGSDEYTCVSDPEDDDFFVNSAGEKIYDYEIDFAYDSDEWSIGNSNYLEVQYMNKTCNVPVSVIESPISEISYTPADPESYVIVENTHGEIDYDDEDGSFFYYDIPSIATGDILTVDGKDYIYKNGSYVSENGERIESYEVGRSGNQYKTHWTAGADNKLTIDYKGAECTVPVSIVKSSVSEISYTPAEPYELIENYQGYEDDYDEDDYYFRYYLPSRRTGDVLTVNNKAYTFNYDEYAYISEDGEEISSGDVGFSSKQYQKHWTLGTDNEMIVTYQGVECTVPVTIKADSVTGIDFEPAHEYRFYENVNAYEDYNGYEYIMWYRLPSYSEGDKLTVYEGSKTTVYTYGYDEDYDGYCFLTEDGSDKVYTGDIERETTQDDEPWVLGGTYDITFTYRGQSTKIQITIEENPVNSVSYKPVSGAIELIENLDGYYETSGNETSFIYYEPYPETGDQIVINNEKTYTYNGDYFVNDNDTSDVIRDFDLEYEGLDQELEPWTTGNTYYMTFDTCGVTCQVPFKIVKNPVTAFSVTINEPLQSIRGYYYRWYQYKVEGWDYYTDKGPFKEGDSITVTKNGTTQKYTMNAGTNYFADGNGNVIYPMEFSYDNEGTYLIGGDYKLTIEYMGVDADPVPITIIKDPAHTHSMIHQAEVKATCISSGLNEYYYCSGCDRYFSDEAATKEIEYEDTVKALTGHTWGTGTVTEAATCSETGVMTYTCTVCGETREEPIPTTDHTWDAGEVTRAATCSRAGTMTYTCTVCGETKTESIPRIAHTLEKVEATESTCSVAGHKAYWHCTECDMLFSDEAAKHSINSPIEIPTLDHTWVETATTATCTEGGETTYKCSVCDATKVEKVAALGHAWSEWADDPDDSTKLKRTCSRCGVSETVPKCEHKNVEAVAAKAATCEADGNIAYWHCKDCDNYFSDEALTTYIEKADTVIPATGHKYGDPAYTWSKDCSTVTATMICANDISHIVTETVSTESTETKKATCTDSGAITYTATFTNAAFKEQTKEVTVAALGHDYKEVPESAKEATCTEAGKEADKKCSRCGDVITGKEIAALGHAEGTAVKENVIAATCEADGSYDEVVYCTRCNKELSRVHKTEPALGHDYEISYDWAEDGSKCTATATCKHDSSHVVKEEGVVTLDGTTEATYDAPGAMTYKATFTNELFKEAPAKDVIIPQLTLAVGEVYKVSGNTYKITAVATNEAVGTVTFTKAKNAKSITIPSTVKLKDGKTYKVTIAGSKAFTASKIRTVTVGANVAKLTKNAFAKSKATKIILKTKKLTKTTVKGSLKSSKVKTVQVKVGSSKVNKTYVKKYKKIFTKSVAGRKVTVK